MPPKTFNEILKVNATVLMAITAACFVLAAIEPTLVGQAQIETLGEAVVALLIGTGAWIWANVLLLFMREEP